MAEPTSAEPTSAELWRCVEETVAHVLLPAISDEWARAAAMQLVGLARYAARRPADPTSAHAAELRAVIAVLADNPVVAAEASAVGQATDADVFDLAGRILAAAVPLTDRAADEVRAVLRSVVVRQLDDQLLVTGPLVAAFRGQLDA